MFNLRKKWEELLLTALECTQSQPDSWKTQVDLGALTKSLEQVQLVQDQLGSKEV